MKKHLSLAGLAICTLMAAALGCGNGGMTGPEMDNPNGPTGPGGPGTPGDYPNGNFGYKVGQEVSNLSFLWHQNGLADVGMDPAKITLGDFYAKRTSGLKLLYLSGAAEWCGPCNQEAEELQRIINGSVYSCADDLSNSCTCAPITPDEMMNNSCSFCADMTKKPGTCHTFAETLKAKGMDNAVEIVQVVLQNADFSPSDRGTIDRWAMTHKATFGVGIDPKMEVSKYIPANAVPVSLVIRVSDMTMLDRGAGAPPYASQMMNLLLSDLAKVAK